ncbi:hypothetical protein CBEIBR21_15195 [Clostridium beijerinckii]|uniref:GmrSD restriction endonucleases N-terminal domain-containing protein n=2 Tax=Clostridium beijerinckii TaxID=1520 RepID=A0A1S9N5E1_CLOBE|nr:DUF262 domain-containing protein [Clostridium beijerinckii]OOP72601.1 hypothetical protein CBEIBR21_15195 [Clostridium beijerinckii]
MINGENIQRVYEWYINGKFLVNRKYQRKLVWTINEKRKFVDSITREYSVPLFLLAAVSKDNKTYYEIIDGMQRLDAIFSFIQGDVQLSDEFNGYFDLATMALTKQLMDEGKLSQKQPVLAREICTKIANYPLPFSITNFDDKHVEEIFRRINSNGRQLSHQDLRQAGAIGEFPNLVRKISSRIRRDYTITDILELSDMRKISLSNYKLNYGIDLSEVFWVKHGIITIKNMRESRDEELVAQILGYMIMGKDISPTSHALNIIYRNEEDPSNFAEEINSKIIRLGSKDIEDTFMKVMDEIDKILRIANKTYSGLLFKSEGKAKVRSFQVIFLVLYKLMQEDKIVSNYDGLIRKLNDLGSTELKDLGENDWDKEKREEKILAVMGIISSYFKVVVKTEDIQNEWVEKLENMLIQSNIEQQMFDFKIGLYNIKKEVQYNDKCLKKIIKTLTAMANTKPGKVGYVFLGIADNSSDSELYKNIYSSEAIEFNDFYITGIKDEAVKSSITLDKYWCKIREAIDKEPIDDLTKSYILRNMKQINYKNKCLIVFENTIIDKPCIYDGNYYERNGNSVVKIEVGSEKFIDLMKRIYSK